MKKSRTCFLSTKIISSYLLFFFLFFTSFETAAQNRNKKDELARMRNKAEVNLDQYYRLKINNLNVPFNNRGNIANAVADSTGGYFDGHIFLFSGGFLMSGKHNDSIWANGVAGDLLVQDYIPGRVNPTPIEPPVGFYVVKKTDPAFGQSWQDWMNAVYLGADFYDGNNDGYYTPIDINGNGQWDPTEDMPDILGDETAWCIYNDKFPQSQRRYKSPPYGIEIRQTVFAYSNIYTFSNVFFIRYRIKNTGTVANQLDSIYFGLYADIDIGDAWDDLTGSDTLRSAGFVYNKGPDDEYGINPPAIFMSMLTTPHSFIPGVSFIDNNANGVFDQGIDTALDSAEIKRGPIIGINQIPGAINLNMNSYTFNRPADALINSPSSILEVRYFLKGLTRLGSLLNPCNFGYSIFIPAGIPCDLINKFKWVSGDPVSNTGWINIISGESRHMSGVGPFSLRSNEEVEMLAAYIVGRGISPLSSISHARAISDDVKWFYDTNFNSSLISIKDELISTNNFILHQNYPNPFNPTTIIRYQIPNTTYVTLKVYDVLGNEVTTLADEEMESGVYETEFNASLLSNGVYFYKIVSENHSISKKMILLK